MAVVGEVAAGDAVAVDIVRPPFRHSSPVLCLLGLGPAPGLAGPSACSQLQLVFVASYREQATCSMRST